MTDSYLKLKYLYLARKFWKFLPLSFKSIIDIVFDAIGKHSK